MATKISAGSRNKSPTFAEKIALRSTMPSHEVRARLARSLAHCSTRRARLLDRDANDVLFAHQLRDRVVVRLHGLFRSHFAGDDPLGHKLRLDRDLRILRQ